MCVYILHRQRGSRKPRARGVFTKQPRGQYTRTHTPPPTARLYEASRGSMLDRLGSHSARVLVRYLGTRTQKDHCTGQSGHNTAPGTRRHRRPCMIRAQSCNLISSLSIHCSLTKEHTRSRAASSPLAPLHRISLYCRVATKVQC